MKRACVAAAIVVTMASPVVARDYGTVGGFDIMSSDNDPETPNVGSCIMTTEYQGAGDTRLRILRQLKDPDVIGVLVDNTNWSIKDGESHKVSYHLDRFYYERTAGGFEEGGRKGLVAAFPADDFLPTFGKSSGFRIRKGDTTVDSLDLDGSGVAVQAFNRCWANLKADEAVKQRERDRFKHIPKDPFK